MAEQMKWHSALAEGSRFFEAMEQVLTDVERALGGAPDLIFAFVSEQHQAHFDVVPATIRGRFPDATLVGCSAGGVAGAGHEVEFSAGISLVAGITPGAIIEPFKLTQDVLPAADASREAWANALTLSHADCDPDFVLLPDPYTIDGERILRGLDSAFVSGTCIGGQASGADRPGEIALFLNDECLRSGAIGVALTGDIVIDAVIAQGARPIGDPMFVTRCEDNILQGLDGRPPQDLVLELYAGLDADSRQTTGETLCLGLGLEPHKTQYLAGDFLVRNIIGLDPESGAMVVGARLEDLQVVQFHAHQPECSTADLRAALGHVGSHGGPPAGALMFACLGRGSTLFDEPEHDTRVFHESVGNVPMGGFFCNGEIAPIGQRTRLHGYASAFGFFRPRLS